VPPEAIRIRQEVALGARAFADIEVRAGQAPPYFVEVDTGYSRERLLESVRRKYGQPVPATDGAARVVVAADGGALGDGRAAERLLRLALRPGPRRRTSVGSAPGSSARTAPPSGHDAQDRNRAAER